MAVLEGARPPGFVLRPPAPAALPAIGDVSSRPGIRAGARPSVRSGGHARWAARARPRQRVGGLLGLIVVAFVLAFFSLAQSVQVAATSYDIVRLSSERDRLDALASDLRKDLNRLGSEPAVRKLALDGGYGQLGTPLVVPAR